ncbi:phage tail domain-containing protein [Bacteroides sp.]|uniref:phage tail domain-containing protein n=1 Tax=Bacteroides sp. TaxID=29523 RepID=UPI00260D563C|nr:phage tail domain-containing protein [Bacteroides sp.]MDD3040085.1 phage tail family protein [Bacteroides sp.]
MIKSVIITNHLGKSIELELTHPEKSGFVVLEITGLGASKADINSTELSNSDGAVYSSARVNSRNIVFKLQAYPNVYQTAEDVRLASYKYFPIKKKIRMIFETENRICEIYGYVESNEPDIFSKEVTMQISVICPDPYFYSAGENGINMTVFYGVESLFEFPFSNESLTENVIEFGDIKNETEQSIYYTGDAEVGVVILINATGEVSDLTIYNATSRTSIAIDTDRLVTLTGSKIINGDEITISTIKGQKSITLLRNGEYINILNCINKDCDWFQLTSGDNLFAYTTEYGVENLQFVILNQTVYEGV